MTTQSPNWEDLYHHYFTKKAISYFVPKKLLGWNAKSKSGNPTKSVLVNNLINKVNKKARERDSSKISTHN